MTTDPYASRGGAEPEVAARVHPVVWRGAHEGLLSSALLERYASVIFDSSLLHGSGPNLSPDPRASLFVVFDSLQDVPLAPFSGRPRRPAHLASRSHQPLPR